VSETKAASEKRVKIRRKSWKNGEILFDSEFSKKFVLKTGFFVMKNLSLKNQVLCVFGVEEN
jgi:hypothetical protein